MRRLLPVTLVLALGIGMRPVHAQGIPVFDLAHIAEIAKTVVLSTLTSQIHKEMNQTITRMSIGLPGLGRFRTPGIISPAHDTLRYLYGAPLLETLNSGDPRATNYFSVVQPLLRDVPLIEGLGSADARQQLRSAYATVEVYDSTNHQSANQVGVTRVYNQTIGGQLDDIERIVTTPDSGTHQMTSVLDTIALSELVSARQNTATTQLQASLVSQKLAQAKAQRDANAAHLMMMMTRIKDRGATANALVSGAGVLSTWSQP